MGFSLVLNPGSTSTKLAIYEDCKLLCASSISHTQEEMSKFSNIFSQKDYRRKLVEEFLKANGVSLSSITTIIGIGGLIKPGRAGVYEVNEDMILDLREARYDEHAANLAAAIGYDLATELKIKAYIADSITADELADIGRLSGIPEITRKGRCHTLNQRYMAKRACQELNISYDKAHLVVAHLGGGISVASHLNGRIVETNAARGEGPFCIDRSGGVNSFELAKMCFSGKYSKAEMLKKINGNGGVVAYLGVRDFRQVEEMMDGGNAKAKQVFDSMVYQIAKEIAAQTVALDGRVDAIVLTGGMAHSKKLTDSLESRVSFLGKVMVFPGEGEMQALADYAEQIEKGELLPMEYRRVN